MNDLSDFIGESDIYKMRDKIVKLSIITSNLTNELKRTPKWNDKKPIKKTICTKQERLKWYRT